MNFLGYLLPTDVRAIIDGSNDAVDGASTGS